uniref:lysophosphatidic acid receptor 3-like n=1 Tax=Pristiophorus japonicus TaxID=55135 RepID=UPI00398E3B1D
MSVTWSYWLVLSLGIPQLGINLVSVICNCLVIVTIVFARHQHKPIFILFGSLALSDLLSSASSFWIALLFIWKPDNTIYGSEDLLRAYAILAISTLSTVYNLMGIGVERYLAVSDCLSPRCRVSHCQTWLVAGTSWALAGLFGGLPLMGWNCLDKEEASSALYRPLCIDYLVFVTIPNCVITFVCLLFTYVAIIVILKRQECIIAAHGHVSHSYRVAEAHVARTSVVIWIMSVVSYAPFFSGVLWDALDHSPLRDLHIHIYVFRNLTAIMITLNSLVNPIVYTHKLKGLGNPICSFKCPLSNKIHVQTIRNA